MGTSPQSRKTSANRLSRANDIEVKATRKEWWYSNIESVIRDSEKLVVMDSVFGLQHVFWEALSKRFDSPDPFHLVYLMLDDNDPFLKRILKLVDIPASLTRVDKGKIAALKTKQTSTKTLEFYFWEGISPGPLIAWTKDGKETIGLGFWMQLSKATDGTPYVLVKRGPLFDDLQRHYKAIIHEARSKEAQVLPESERLSEGTERHTSRLSQVKKQLRAYVLEADEMYDRILVEKVATQSLPEAERTGRLSVFVPPDCRGWHTDVEALVEKELGRSQANEFASEYRQWDAYDWSDLDFLMTFLSRKRDRLRDIAKTITEADLEQ